MGTRITLPDFKPDASVELGSSSGPHGIVDFEVLAVTIDKEEKLNELQEKANEIAVRRSSKPLDLFTIEAEQLDVILAPIAAPAGDQGSKKPLPSEILIEAYKSKKMTRAQLQGLVTQITAAARPT